MAAGGSAVTRAEMEIQLAELVEQPFDQREFALRLLEIYNAPKATLTKLRTGTQNKGEQPGDILWSRKLFFGGLRRAFTPAFRAGSLSLNPLARGCRRIWRGEIWKYGFGGAVADFV
jgi:hypothetical protein